MRYIIGDVHGCIKTLEALIKKLPPNAKITFVGDLVDRGKDSKRVVEFVKEGQYDCVLGNHELVMSKVLPKILKNPKSADSHVWYALNGGYETMRSYGLTGFFKSKTDIAYEHIEWFKQLPLYLEYPDIKNNDGRYLVVTHAPVNSLWKFKNAQLGTDESTKFRKEVLRSRKNQIVDNPDIFNIFGHTPYSLPIMKNHYANIDTGCVYSDGDLLGNLTALEFPSMRTITQKNID